MAKVATLGESGRPREASSPEDVDAEVEGEVQEELVEMAQVGGVAVGVEHGGRGVRVAHVHRRQRVPPARAEAQHLDVLPVGLPAERGDPGPGVLHQRVRRRRRREPGFRSISSLPPSGTHSLARAAPVWFVQVRGIGQGLSSFIRWMDVCRFSVDLAPGDV